MPTFTLSTIALDFDTGSPPMKPATGVSGFSATVNGTPRSITSVYRALEYRFAIILSSPMASSDVVRLSYSGGNVTDSASIGGSMDQPIDDFSDVLVTYNPFGVDLPLLDGTEPEELEFPALDPAQIFVNAPNGDFRLIVGSFLIDVGTNVGLPYRGFAPDLGAIEFPDDTFNNGPVPGSGSSAPIVPIIVTDTLSLSLSEIYTLLALVEKTATDDLNVEFIDLASGYDLITQVDKTLSGELLNMTISGASNQQLLYTMPSGARSGFMANFDYAYKRQTAKIVWGGVESGDPRVGPAVRIKEGSTFDNFTGYVAVYVPSTMHVELRLYNGEILSDPGTLIRDLDLTVPVASGIPPATVPLFPSGLSIGDELMIESGAMYEENYQDPNYTKGSIRIMVNDYLLRHDILGQQQDIEIGMDAYLPISNGGVGIVACGIDNGAALIDGFTGGEKSSETRMVRSSNAFVFCGTPITWQSFEGQDFFLGHRYVPEEFRIRSRLENESCYGFQAVKTWDYKKDCSFGLVVAPIGDCSSELVVTSRAVGFCPDAELVEQYVVGSYSGVDIELNYASPDCSTGGNVSLGVDSASNIVTLSGADGCPLAGFSLVNGHHHTGVQLNSVNMAYESIAGQPVQGVALWVTADSTPLNFTGWVCLDDAVNNRTLVGYYVNANIMNSYPTIVAVGSLMPIGGPFPFMLSYANEDTNELGFDFGDDNGGMNITVSNLSSYPILFSHRCGVIWIGNPNSGTHSARWTRYIGNTAWEIS